MEEIVQKKVRVNGLDMHVAEKGNGPTILFIHGFPELWYSWRHQILYFADNGYRAVAPDLRGYGGTTGAPNEDVGKFSIMHLVGDLVMLLEELAPDEEKVYVVAHDWGAIIGWNLCLLRPDKVKAYAALSVYYSPRNPNPATRLPEYYRAIYGDDHYIWRFQVMFIFHLTLLLYIFWFWLNIYEQEVGDIEGEFEKIGVKEVMKKFLTYRKPAPLFFPKGKGFGDSGEDDDDSLPSWLSPEDLDYYADNFTKTGFTGGVNYYRALNLNWELLAAWTGAQVKVPAKYIVGDLDLVYNNKGAKEYIHSGELKKNVPLLEDIVVMEGVAHFLMQESPDEVNKHIHHFLKNHEKN
ncbi:epoxide hydrolase A-like [Impatiens glandulifera]|uniref:epoxide hydrolase A-like n=1 Tax=Impatiens glandulifera TaxID=253017 RepID=UPI001FB1737C|nr:epoxide hydrolase A-like [Impatiens glandulifera]